MKKITKKEIENKNNPAQEAFEILIEKYKIQNPTKYVAKIAELETKKSKINLQL